MPFTLAGLAFSTARLTVPRYGIATGLVELQAVSVPPLSVAQRATLQIGDLSLVGTLLPGGVFGGVESWGWVAGAGRWSTPVDRRGYRDDAGVLLSAVLADLARDAGELGAVLDGVPDRRLGYAWVRPAARASDLLRALVGDAWWLASDGITHAGPRPASSAAPTDLTVDPYDPITRQGTVALAGDAVSQLLPGTTLTAQGLPAPLLIGQLEVRAQTERVDAMIWGEATGPELLARVLHALQERARYAAPQAFQVTATSGSRATVEPADVRTADLPGEPFLDSLYGLPGASAVLQAGAPVLVAFPSGDPGQPLIVSFGQGVLPVSLGLSATTEIDLTAPLVKAGGAGGHKVVVDNGLTTWLHAVRTACTAAGHDPGPPPVIAATQVEAL